MSEFDKYAGQMIKGSFLKELLNKFYPTSKFIKVTNNEMTSGGMNYVIGKNTDISPGQPSYIRGGIGFTHIAEISRKWYGDKNGFHIIDFDDNEDIFVGHFSNFRAKTIILHEKTLFSDITNEQAIEFVLYDSFLIERIPQRHRNNKLLTIALQKCKNKRFIMYYVHTHETDNQDLAIEMLKIDPYYIDSCPERFKSNLAMAIAAVSKSGYAIEHFDQSIRENVMVAFIAVSKRGHALRYTSEKIRNNKQIVLAAINQTWTAFYHCSMSLKDDYDVVIAAVTKNWEAIIYCSERLRNNVTIATIAVLQNKKALKHCSKEMQNTYEVVLAAVSKYWQAIKYCSEEMRHNKNILYSAILQNWKIVYLIKNDVLKNDIYCALAAVQQNPYAIKYFAKEVAKKINTN